MVLGSDRRFVALGSRARTGTTWLHRYLAARTDAGMPAIKEMHYFDEIPEIAEELETDERVLKRHLRRIELVTNMMANVQQKPDRLNDPARQKLERLAMTTDVEYQHFYEKRFGPDQTCFDMTPSYLLMPIWRWRRLLEVFPKTKIITLLRNPASHFNALVNHRLVRGVDPDRPTDLGSMRAVRFGETVLDMHKRENLMNLPRVLREVRELVGPDRHLVRFTEDIFSDRQAQTLSEICDFAEINQTSDEPFDYDGNTRSYAPMPDHQRRKITLLMAEHFRLAEELVGRLPPSWEKDRVDFLT